MSTKGIHRKHLDARLRGDIRRVRRFLCKCLRVRLIKWKLFLKATLIMVVLLIMGTLSFMWSNFGIALDYSWNENLMLERRYWVGCYADWVERDLPVLAQGESTDLKHCLNLCANYLYLALQNNICWCGNEYATRPEHKRLPKQECFNNSEKLISPNAVYRTRTNKLDREDAETYVCIEDMYNKKIMSVFWTYRLSVYGSGRFRYVPMTNRQSCWKPSSDRPTVGSVWSREATVTIAGHELCRKFDTKRIADFTWYWDRAITSKWNSTSSTAYFPLTPRFEFGLIAEEELTTSSKRKYAYSFSGAATSTDRVTMADVVPKLSSSKGFIHIIADWQPLLPENNSTRPEDTGANKYMSAKQYRELLLDSVFTLCPIGHNPECYRIWEACEAGSIPIINIGEAYQNHSCGGVSLKPLIDSDAPFLFVQSWKEVPKVIDRVANNPVEADLWQKKLVLWYDRFLRDVVNRFEARLIQRMETMGK